MSLLLDCTGWPCADMAAFGAWGIDTSLPVSRSADLALQANDPLKVVKTLTRHDVVHDAQHEVFLHTAVNGHPNIVRLFPELCVVRRDCIQVVTERGYTDVFSLVNNRYAESQRLDAMPIFAALVLAVQHVHGKGVIHGDIKPENIVLGTDKRYKLIDFGGARQLDMNGTCLRPAICTPEFSAPEVVSVTPCYATGTLEMLGRELATKCMRVDGRAADVWSVAVTAAMIALSTEMYVFNPDVLVPLWRAYRLGRLTAEQAEAQWHNVQTCVEGETQSMHHIFASLEHVCPAGLTSLLKQCLSFDPSKRPLIGGLVDYVIFYASQGPLKPAYS